MNDLYAFGGKDNKKKRSDKRNALKMYLKSIIISKNQLSLFPCRNITEDKGEKHNA